MKKEIIGNCTLYCGDARGREWVSDSVITDPVWPICPKGFLPGAEDPERLWIDVCSKSRARDLLFTK